MKSPAELIERFRAEGRKVTPQRVAVFTAVHALGDHPTAEAVYDEVVKEQPTISLRTVYQTLNDLVAFSELQSLEVGGGPTRFDTMLESHHHLVCDSCGLVRDVHADYASVEMPTEFAGQFSVSATEIVFRGQCDACRTAAAAS